MFAPLPGEPPVTPVRTTVHEKVVPGKLLDNAIDVLPPVQNVCEAGVAVTTGFGFTVRVTKIGMPLQLPTDGVIEYVTVPALVPVVNKVCEIVAPLPADAPETPVGVAVQLNIVPGILLESVIAVGSPEQIVCVVGLAVAMGSGLIVTVTGMDAPVQFTVDGVTVYTTVPVEVPVATIV
jgi:hypothetical protein